MKREKIKKFYNLRQEKDSLFMQKLKKDMNGIFMKREFMMFL